MSIDFNSSDVFLRCSGAVCCQTFEQFGRPRLRSSIIYVLVSSLPCGYCEFAPLSFLIIVVIIIIVVVVIVIIIVVIITVVNKK
jgi:hypothetical protein